MGKGCSFGSSQWVMEISLHRIHRKLWMNLNLQETPPSIRYLDKHIHHWALAKVNDGIRNLQLPYLEPLNRFAKENYVFSHRYLSSIASFRLSNAGLGNRRPIPGLPRLKVCPHCNDHPLDEPHLLFSCRIMKDAQMVLGLTKFKLQCKGDALDRICFLYVNGLDSYGNTIPLDEQLCRGAILQRITCIWLQSLPTWAIDRLYAIRYFVIFSVFKIAVFL